MKGLKMIREKYTNLIIIFIFVVICIFIYFIYSIHFLNISATKIVDSNGALSLEQHEKIVISSRLNSSENMVITNETTINKITKYLNSLILFKGTKSYSSQKSCDYSICFYNNTNDNDVNHDIIIKIYGRAYIFYSVDFNLYKMCENDDIMYNILQIIKDNGVTN